MQVTTVAARGEAECDYNVVTFTVHLSALGPSTDMAKVLLKEKVDLLLSTVADLKPEKDVVPVKNSIRATSSVNEKWEYNRTSNVNEFKGYEAMYNYSFQIHDMDKASDVYDFLTSLKEATVGAPSFGVKSFDKVNNKALQNAFDKVTDRFKTECKVLGLDPNNYVISVWEASYSDSRRSDRVSMRGETMSLAAAPVGGGAGRDNSILLNPGKAKVFVNLEVGYKTQE